MQGQLAELEQRLLDAEVDRRRAEYEAARSAELQQQLAEQREETARVAQEAYWAGTLSASRHASRHTSAAPSPRQSVSAGTHRVGGGSATAAGKPPAVGHAEMVARALDPNTPWNPFSTARVQPSAALPVEVLTSATATMREPMFCCEIKLGLKGEAMKSFSRKCEVHPCDPGSWRKLWLPRARNLWLRAA